MTSFEGGKHNIMFKYLYGEESPRTNNIEQF